MKNGRGTYRRSRHILDRKEINRPMKKLNPVANFRNKANDNRDQAFHLKPRDERQQRCKCERCHRKGEDPPINSIQN